MLCVGLPLAKQLPIDILELEHHNRSHVLAWHIQFAVCVADVLDCHGQALSLLFGTGCRFYLIFVLCSTDNAGCTSFGGVLPPHTIDDVLLCLFCVVGQVSGPILVLNGEGENSSGPVNNVVFLEETAPSYAPEVPTVFSVFISLFSYFLVLLITRMHVGARRPL